MTKEQTRPQEIKTPWYKSAILPWALIGITLLYASGIYTGWTLRSQDAGRVSAEASVIAQQMAKKPELKEQK